MLHSPLRATPQKLFAITLTATIILSILFSQSSVQALFQPDQAVFYISADEPDFIGLLQKTIQTVPPKSIIRIQGDSCERHFELDRPLPVDKPVTIQGYGPECVIIDGHGRTSMMEIKAKGVVMQQLSIRNGNGPKGSAIHVFPGAEFLMQDMEIDNNEGDDGAVLNEGNLTILSSSFWRNHSSKSTAALVSTQMGTIMMGNVTFAENTSEAEGGAMRIAGEATLIHVTIADNKALRGGGFVIEKSGTLHIDNSIVANNEAESGAENCLLMEGSTLAGNANLEFGGATPTCPRDSFHVGDPKLSPAARNSPVLTHSMAIDKSGAAYDAAGTKCAWPLVLSRDQRGMARPQGAHCDIGAYEIGDQSNLTPTPTATRRPSRTPLPTRTPTPSKTPRPSITPRPSRTPIPTRTSVPSKTLLPTHTMTPVPNQR